MPRKLALLIFLALPSFGTTAADAIELRHLATLQGVTLTVNPLDAASRTAFYLARGFTAAALRPYIAACGFSFGMQNAGSGMVRARLADWHAVGADGKRIALRLPETWDADWQKAGVTRAARIAFKWAQFQAENVLDPGDWIMGMATLNSEPKPPFRLVARYQDNKGDHELVLDKLECARD